jgi:uncharacterized protein YcaQ
MSRRAAASDERPGRSPAQKRTTHHLSQREARWLALAAQGLDRPRPRARGRRALRTAIERLGALQLDAVNVLERPQFVVPFSRLGGFDRKALHGLCGPDGALFEYWGHAASLLPVSLHPFFRWRMAEFRSPKPPTPYMERWRAWGKANAPYIRRVQDEIRERGPLSAGQLADPRRRDGPWWNRRSVGRQALEHLFAQGKVAAWRNESFERVYDLPERVIPGEVLARPTPSGADAQRELIAASAAALGIGTAGDLADYYRIRNGPAAARVAELVEAGRLERVHVEGWREPAYRAAGLRAKRPTRAHATLLSPFDSLIWERDRTSRLFDFDYRIEIYVPAPKRRHGYYVLPLLLGDELVARFDLKADRKSAALRVEGAYLEPGSEAGPVAEAAVDELRALGSWLGLATLRVGRRGNLARALRRAAQ